MKRLGNPLLVGRPASLDPLLPEPRRPRRRDRRDDAAPARGEGRSPERVRVIPNWVDTKALVAAAAGQPVGAVATALEGGSSSCTPATSAMPRTSTRSSARHFAARSGAAVGRTHRRRRAARDHLRLARHLDVDKVSFIDYQPRELLPQSLSAADVHFVGLPRGLSGYVVPSRVYGILAAGRPIIAAADEDSETARLVRRIGCGVDSPARQAGPPRRGDQASRERRVRPRDDGASRQRVGRGRGRSRARGRAVSSPRRGADHEQVRP